MKKQERAPAAPFLFVYFKSDSCLLHTLVQLTSLGIYEESVVMECAAFDLLLGKHRGGKVLAGGVAFVLKVNYVKRVG